MILIRRTKFFQEEILSNLQMVCKSYSLILVLLISPQYDFWRILWEIFLQN